MPDPQKEQWLKRVLGVSMPVDKPKKQVRFDPVAVQIPTRSDDIRIGAGRGRSDALIAPQQPPQRKVVEADGKKLEIARKANGRIVYTAPPPPVGEVTFSGGGGKGVVLPGAVKALEEGGVLKDARKIAGASVGSMTAALVAAGITAEEFKAVADSAETTLAVTDGTGGGKLALLGAAISNRGSPLTGQGLEKAVREVIDETLRKRIAEYLEDCQGRGVPGDPAVLEVLKKLSSNKAGPTFRDYRTLSQAIPSIKEVVITGTYTTEKSDQLQGFDAPEKEKDETPEQRRKRLAKGPQKLEGGNDRGQLYVFDADSEPDLEVAVAVHASASFPVAFKPVEMKLSNGLTVTFVDGGVMNNTPTSSSLGRDRELDPVPQQRGVTFVFEDEAGHADAMKKGNAKPGAGLKARAIDAFLGASHHGAEYGKNRSAADKPNEIVVVPLQGTVQRKKLIGKGTKSVKVDMRGGTLEFNLAQDKRDELRRLTEKATKEQIEADKQPKSREFASESQMFVSIPIGELKALAGGQVPGAAEALAFREKVAEQIAVLVAEAKKHDRAADALAQGPANAALDALDQLAGQDVDFQGYVGRELNRKPELDLLLEAARRIHRNGGKESGTMAACDAVAETLRARSFADNILKQLVYPKMKQEPEGGAGILTLLTLEQLLRTVQSPDDVNTAIDFGVAHFEKKPDRRVPKRGHQEFAQQLKARRMRPAR